MHVLDQKIVKFSTLRVPNIGAYFHMPQHTFSQTDGKVQWNDHEEVNLVPFFLKLQEFDLKKPLKIKYVGGGEEGLDMGGLQKEFFHMIVEAVFDPGNIPCFLVSTLPSKYDKVRKISLKQDP